MYSAVTGVQTCALPIYPWGKSEEQIILEMGINSETPIAAGFPAGHLNDNRAFYMGRNAELIVNENSAQLTWK